MVTLHLAVTSRLMTYGTALLGCKLCMTDADVQVA